MERYKTTMRAARYLLGAGTFAIAMVAMTGAAEAQTQECVGEAPVCGHVYTETNGVLKFQVGEGTDDVQVVLVDSMGHPVETIQLNPQTPGVCTDVSQLVCGYYEFAAVAPGDYRVCIVVNGQNTDCRDVPAGAYGQIEDFLVQPGGENEPVDAEPPYTNFGGSGTGTPGYWKNHPAMWPDSITVGGVTYYKSGTPNITDAIARMGKVSKDKTITMFASLISAKLNTATNVYDCIAGTLFQADKWLTTYPVGSGVAGSSEAWEVGEPLHSKLDDYNNGKLCAPHRN